jgi:hypothetical protein
MTEPRYIKHRIRGYGDIAWIAALACVGAVVVVLLLSHLQNGYEIFRLANQIAIESRRVESLENDRRALTVELQRLRNEMDVFAAAEALGFGPVVDEQRIVIERPQ